MGISFYTFQTISYLIEVYYGNIIAEKHLGYFALFVIFFPQLVAGPIERAQDLLPQLRSIHCFSYENAVYGTKLMVWGYFKKMVVADTLAIYVNRVYNDVTSINSGLTLMIATFFFAVQLYCDFSAYSDIARGCAKIMGIELMTNFKSPVFFSKSIKEYWHRHHISLSNWFTSYVYIPLGGNRRGLIRQYFNTTVTFLLSGLWHGADWTFVVWGGVHSIYINVGDFLRRSLKRENIVVLHNKKLQMFMSIVVTCVLSCFAWIFFRANSIQDASYIVCNLFRGLDNPKEFIVNGLYYSDLLDKVLPLLILLFFDWINEKHDVIQLTEALPKRMQGILYIGFLLYITFAVPDAESSPFIYFQF